jgi:hypothetical protein
MATSDHAVIEALVFDSSTCFLPTAVASVNTLWTGDEDFRF